jgi:hypothetical protein
MVIVGAAEAGTTGKELREPPAGCPNAVIARSGASIHPEIKVLH